MTKKTYVSGLQTVLSNLKGAKDKLGFGVARGLKKGGLHLLEATDKFIPVQLGTLRNSKFIRNIGGSGFSTDILVGFTADYAVFVHEDMEKAHGEKFNIKYAEEITSAVGTKKGTAKGGMFERGEEQQAKFLERPAREERRKILTIIAREAKI